MPAITLGGIAALVELLSALAEFPVVTRWMGHAVVAILLGFHASKGLGPRGRTVATTTVAAAVTAVLILVPLPGGNDDDNPTRGDQPTKIEDKHRTKPRPKVIDVGGEPVATAHGFGLQWVLNRDGKSLASTTLASPAASSRCPHPPPI